MIGIFHIDICQIDYASDLSSTHTQVSMKVHTYVPDDRLILTNEHMYSGFFSIQTNPLEG
jgi:hypothetical protein